MRKMQQDESAEEQDAFLQWQRNNQGDDALDAVIEALNAGVERKLSRQERQAFQLVVREGKTLSKAALLMTSESGQAIAKQTVRTYVLRAADKIRAHVLRKRS